jgi:uncharacterized protein with FMN-binding domain
VKGIARRPLGSAVLTVLAIVAVLRLRGPEPTHRRALISPHARPPVARRTTGAPAPATHPPTTKPPTTAPPARTSYTGDTYDTRYGPVQVRMTVQGSRIVDVKAIQLPSEAERSREISAYAAPKLRQEALDAQSANIDTVSGATYTSDAYASSLQSAIDQWHH